jgi:site-specific DNA-methyltransferase (adenine-specific)
MTTWKDKFLNKIVCGDCLDLLKEIPDNSVDLVLCDLPYGNMTGNNWDVLIPLDKLWIEYKRIIKDNGSVLLTATNPFASILIQSNKEMYKYDWVWEKENGTNCVSIKYQPFKIHEYILCFSKGKVTYTPQGHFIKYNPQMTKGEPYHCISGRHSSNWRGGDISGFETINKGKRFPKSIIYFPRDKEKLHPTQKPLALFEYLIKTYTNKGDLVLDNCIGSGTTAVACKQLGRDFIGIEISPEYCKIAEQRLKAVPEKLMGFDEVKQ